MNLRGIFKDSSVFVQIAILVGAFFSGMLFGMFIFFLHASALGIPLDSMNTDPAAMRMMQFWVSVFSFLVPACLLAQLFSDDAADYLQLYRTTVPTVLLTLLVVVAALPFLNLMISLNEQIVFPESLRAVETFLRQMEDNAQQATKLLLSTKSVSAFAFNILLFAVVAGLGEEFFFRGVMQRMAEKVFSNPHVVIWVVAFLFSAFHFQFYGLIPRMLLGALMGYLLLWTRSMWVPAIAHFANNLIGVLSYYFVSDKADLEQFDTLGTNDTWWLAFLSLALALLILLGIKKINQPKAT